MQCCPDLVRCCPLAATRQTMQGLWAPTSYIECMFESDLVELDAARTLAAAEANEHALITADPPPPNRCPLGRPPPRRGCRPEPAARRRTSGPAGRGGHSDGGRFRRR